MCSYLELIYNYLFCTGHSEMADIKDDLTDSLLDVESGIEALEETIEGFGDVTNKPISFQNDKPPESSPNSSPPTQTNFGLPPSKSNLKNNPLECKKYFLNFTMYFLTVFLIINYVLFPKSNVWNGFLLGIWCFSLASCLKHWLLDNYFSHWEPQKGRIFQLKRSSAIPAVYTIPSVKEHQPLKKYEVSFIIETKYPYFISNVELCALDRLGVELTTFS